MKINTGVCVLRRVGTIIHALGTPEMQGGDSDNTQDEQYDLATAPYKRALLAQIGTLRPASGPRATVLEIGIGSFSHAELYPASVSRVVGVEPDVSRHPAALAAARACGLSLSMLRCAVLSLCGREGGREVCVGGPGQERGPEISMCVWEGSGRRERRRRMCVCVWET